MKRALVWSNGGGTQSTAIAALIATGKLPRPERAIIADTGRESSETWQYLERYVRPLLWEAVRLEVEIAPHSLATVDLYSLKTELLIPAYTGNGNLSTFCSSEWKASVIRRYLRSAGYGPNNPVMAWIGISLDEIGRCKPSGREWIQYEWPLVMGVPAGDAAPRLLRRGRGRGPAAAAEVFLLDVPVEAAGAMEAPAGSFPRGSRKGLPVGRRNPRPRSTRRRVAVIQPRTATHR